MTPQERLHFIRQLHHWSEALIEVGRYPFRRAEIFAPILTADGLQFPPLVLWVNRQSLQAGGLIFLAEKEENLDQMANCARAIGINHFVLWTSQKLSIWEQPQPETAPRECWQASVPRSQQVQGFQLQLTEIFDQLRERVIPGMLPDTALPPDYFATLSYHCLLAIRRPLLEALRIARGTHNIPTDLRPAHAALTWSIILLAKRLARRSDEQTHAQGSVTEQLTPVLPTLFDELTIPEEATALLNQFEHRLRQLKWGSDSQLTTATVARLEKLLSPVLGCRTELPRRLPLGGRRLFVNMNVATANDTNCISPALVTLKQLRHLLSHEESDHAFMQLDTLSPMSYDHIAANLPRHPFAPLPFTDGQGKTLLRKVWPNRRFTLAAKTQSWVYQTLALLAAIKPEGELILDLPDEWLVTPATDEIFSIIVRHYRFRELHTDRHRSHQIRLKRTASAEALTIHTGYGQRQLPFSNDNPLNVPQLKLAIASPPALWNLIESGQLSPLLSDDPRASLRKELEAYRSSQCGNYLGRYLDRVEALPTPSFELLSLFTGAVSASERSKAESQLYIKLGIGEIDWDEEQNSSSSTATTRRSPRLARAKILEDLQLAARAEGLPRFPEHYLYDYFKPELTRYTFSGELQLQGEFFGSIQLADPQGNVIEVNDSATAAALRLCSQGGETEALLPADTTITATIVKRYLDDLDKLRHKLHDLAHRRIDDQRQANRLVNEIWAQLPFPSFKLLDKIDSID